MDTIKTINVGEVTSLPAVQIARGDSIGRCIKIQTPHRGEVVIEYHEQGMFREKNVAMQELVAKIIALENEAKQFLLNEWVASQK